MSEAWRGKSILIVEDCQETLDLQKSLCERMGFSVVGALKSGTEAVATASALKPDFISLDIIMPEMDGIECYFKLKEAGIKSQIFFVSALSSEPRVVQAYAGEISERCFLSKPLSEDNLRKYLDSIESPIAGAIPPPPPVLEKDSN